MIGRDRHRGGRPPRADLRGEPLRHVAPATRSVDAVTATRYWTMASDGGSGLWGVRARDDALVRLDPRTGEERARTASPAPECVELTAAPGALYMGCTHTWVGVVRLDPETLRVVWRTALPVG